MADSITYNEVLDNIDHAKHGKFVESCVGCKREARLIKAKKTVGRNDNYPPDVLRHLLN